MIRKIKNKKGFTLVELLIYVALLGFFVSGAVLFTWDIIYGRERTFQKEVMDQNIRSAMARMGYEIRQAKTINSISPSLLELENNDGTITQIALVDEKIQLSPSGNGPYALTSNLVRVTELNFVDRTSSDQNSKNVEIQLRLEPTNYFPGQQTISSSSKQSIEFNSQFNLARQLLIDLSGSTFTGSNRLTNAKIRNTGSVDLLIDKLVLTWTNSSPSQAVTEVQIAGGDLEWVGSASSGEEIDIIDYLLVANSSQDPVNHLQFNSDLDGEILYVTFILIDGSSTTSLISIGASSATSGSCLEYCSSLNYSSGLCRRSPRQCDNASEINESAGDIFCTVNPEDTCCCQP